MNVRPMEGINTEIIQAHLPGQSLTYQSIETLANSIENLFSLLWNHSNLRGKLSWILNIPRFVGGPIIGI